MIFSSFNFLFIFLPVVLVIYHVVLRKSAYCQIIFLTFCSLYFYAYSNLHDLPILILSIMVNSLFLIYIINNDRSNISKIAYLLGITFNVGLLVFFKYTYLLSSYFLNESDYSDIVDITKKIPLPIGISFFTFHAISLMVDVWRGKVPTLDMLIKHGNKKLFNLQIWFYISFFPQSLAGPIVKGHDFFPQIGLKKFYDINIYRSVKFLIIGYFLKSFIADNISESLSSVDPFHFIVMSKLDLAMLLYGYSIQIFSDFAGYSFIAMGLAGLFGYNLPINFNYPYISRSITEFWRRWHISLSSWLKEYLYIPLGGSKRGIFRTYINLFITMLLGGLWHGAAWTFGLWGALQGTLLILERIWKPSKLVIGNSQEIIISRWLDLFKIFIIFNIISVLWLFFRLPDFNSVIIYARCFIHNPWYIDFGYLYIVLIYGIPIFLYHAKRYQRDLSNKDLPLFNSKNSEMVALGFMLFLTISNYGPTIKFIYFQF